MVRLGVNIWRALSIAMPFGALGIGALEVGGVLAASPASQGLQNSHPYAESGALGDKLGAVALSAPKAVGSTPVAAPASAALRAIEPFLNSDPAAPSGGVSESPERAAPMGASSHEAATATDGDAPPDLGGLEADPLKRVPAQRINRPTNKNPARGR